MFNLKKDSEKWPNLPRLTCAKLFFVSRLNAVQIQKQFALMGLSLQLGQIE
jgi:hypothetical protein